MQKRYADKGGTNAMVVKLRLPDGSLYGHDGKIDYVEPTVSATTDTILLRARIANPPLGRANAGQPVERPLVDGAFVTVLVEGIQPVMALGIPRKAVLSDQQGDYVYVVGSGNKVEQRRIQLGQSTPNDRRGRRRSEGRRDGRHRRHPARSPGHRGQSRPGQRHHHRSAKLGQVVA